MLFAYDILNFGQMEYLSHLIDTIDFYRMGLTCVEDPVDYSLFGGERHTEKG